MSENETIRAKLRHLPDRPGVYLMRDMRGEILYVGKAKGLRSRVRSYFASAHPHSVKTRELVRRIADFDTIVVDSEAEALILENTLIKQHRPRFNINLKDDKTYPYIKVTTHEAVPRIYVTRKLHRDGARYFGPFAEVGRMRQALDLVKKLYTVRSCRLDLPGDAPARPCLDYDIGRCKAPCVGHQTLDEYRGMIEEIVEVLAGRTEGAEQRLREEMAAAAAELNFERAAEVRDALNELEVFRGRQKVADLAGGDRDAVGLARDGDRACGVVLRFRAGKLVAREPQWLVNLTDEADDAVMGALVGNLYAALDPDQLPGEVLLPADFADRELWQTLLSERSGRSIQLRAPQRGDKVDLVALAQQNARHLLEERKLVAGKAAGGTARAPDALFELQRALSLPAVPRTMVCFDVSHTQGTETVASAVFFENARPNKAEYRKLKIRGDWGNDDFRSMHEAVTRYVRRRLEEAKPLPDLLVIDGGKGQLGAAQRALEEQGLRGQAVIALAKRDEELFVPERPDPVRLPRRSPALRVLQQIRDEAHRFALTYNRKLRSDRTLTSVLSSIPGVGPARQRTLLQRFGSAEGVRQATPAQVAAVPGFGPALARVVLDHLNRAADQGSTPAAAD